MGAEQTHERFGIGGRVALVTGASRNIGRAIALTLAEAGATPIVLYHQDEAAADEVCEAIAERGAKSAKFQADLCDVPRLQEIVGQIEADFGGVDILVNNAALRPNSKISDITITECDEVFAINLRAPFFLAQAVLPHMVRGGWGRIVNIGGSDAYQGKARRAHGVATKSGIAGLTRALALETARFGVTVNTLVPGVIDTERPRPEWYPGIETGFAQRKERLPMARLGTPQEVANACLFLASEMATFTTGQELFVSGGTCPLVRQPLEEYEADEF
ncbi:MAG: SDR family oxidoreductase [Rhizobiales bacterium]|nr:SDR family oxidoreductase [Hyphomicrobiales bacterium]